MQLKAVVRSVRPVKQNDWNPEAGFDLLCTETQPATLLDQFHLFVNMEFGQPKLGASVNVAINSARPYALDGRTLFVGEVTNAKA